MKIKFLTRSFICVVISMQSLASPATSPKDIVEQFVKMDVEGTRLTPQGWYAADALFSKSSAPVSPRVLVVIARSYAVSKVPQPGALEKNGKVQFAMGYEEVGKLDASSLRFTPTTNGNMKEFDSYSVVPINVERSSDELKGANKAQPAALSWKIDGAQPATMHLTARAAIQYVGLMRRKKSEPSIQENADKAIMALAPYR